MFSEPGAEANEVFRKRKEIKELIVCRILDEFAPFPSSERRLSKFRNSSEFGSCQTSTPLAEPVNLGRCHHTQMAAYFIVHEHFRCAVKKLGFAVLAPRQRNFSRQFDL